MAGGLGQQAARLRPRRLMAGDRSLERLRNIITQFVCIYNGLEVFRADLYPAIAANPFITFQTVATASGTFEFKWTGDNDFAQTETANITVE